MCIIAEITSTTPALSIRWHDEFTESNPDGFGIVTHDPSAPFKERVKAFKTMDANELWQHIQAARAAGLDAIVHYRQATHGSTSLEMAHPFTIHTKHAGLVAVIHNGMLQDYPDTGDKAHSDTYSLVYGMIAPMIQDMKPRQLAAFIRSSAFRWTIENILGNSNRLVITDQDGHVTYNDDIWHTRQHGDLNGMRLSNTYAWADIDRPATTTPPAWQSYYQNGKYTTPTRWSKAYSSTSSAKTTVYDPVDSYISYEPADTDDWTSGAYATTRTAIDTDALDWISTHQSASRETITDEAYTDPDLVAAACYLLMNGG